MMINGGGGGGSGSDEDDVMTTMTATTNGSGGLWDGGGEGRPTMNVTNIAELQFSISSRRIPIASLICSCLYHLPTDAARGITSFRKNPFIGIIYALPLCTRCLESSKRYAVLITNISCRFS